MLGASGIHQSDEAEHARMSLLPANVKKASYKTSAQSIGANILQRARESSSGSLRCPETVAHSFYTLPEFLLVSCQHSFL